MTTYATTTATITRGITVSPSLPSSSVARSTEVIGSRSIATHMAPMPIANPCREMQPRQVGQRDTAHRAHEHGRKDRAAPKQLNEAQ